METAELQIKTGQKNVMLPISGLLADLVQQRGWQDGILTVFVPHTTAGVTINENADPDVARDMTWFMQQLVPDLPGFRHVEGNSDAHIKASLFGSSVQVIVRAGTLWLGTWQGVYFCEFDGPRQRQVRLAFS
ncbi:YjbQ family protein [Trichlorobacter lovleyi]|uniref:secondary thiamine-phosphate synthase enzyme YjbQ n=1 Tax=Trichlorobacter lovleyi TaxID=313985 RepID=UPI00223E9D4B|nr:secondary thiamine-phosphate synthase enzyme YjbQ [Trichlorobacter lovleyi]QOX79607.1 YjbQ family protein [Trichlorobacter lovleyi]